jgi:hypothetical protein
MAKEDKTPAESKAEAFAEDLGRLLGTAERKASEWLNQRTSVAAQLAKIRDTAAAMLEQLGEGRAKGRGKGTSKAASPRANKDAKKKPRVMSAKARAAISAAQKRRWAKVRQTKGIANS